MHYDPYPTRLEHPRDPLRRVDPVLHGAGGSHTPGPLSRDQLERFERDGFLILDEPLPRNLVEAFRADLAAYARDPELLARDTTITEADDDGLRSLFAVHRLSARFDRLTRSPHILDAVMQILGSDVYIHQSRINAKPAFSGRGFAWHSDFETWHAEDGMPRMRCLSVSISLTENNPYNGPLMLVPGSHRWFLPTVGETPERYWERSLKRQRQGVPEPDDLKRLIDAGGIHVCQGGPGTIVLFECNTMHASADNLSPWPRSNLFFVYNSVENRLEAPYAAPEPRPEWIAARAEVEALAPLASDIRRIA